jgi:pimeloyl-ACP methyl ester carboxylesterase
MPTTLDSTELAYHWAGPTSADVAKVVLMHGLGDSGECWPDAVRRWSQTYRVVGVDLLGHGHSPRFTRDQLAMADPMEAMYAAAEATVAHLAAASGPVLVVAHSMGGGIAGALAARRPDLVSALVLEDPAWRDPEHRVQPPDVVEERIADCQAFRDDLEGQLEQGRKDNPTWPEAEFRPWAESKTQVDLEFLRLGIANLLEPWDRIVAAIAVPALTLVAGQGGPVLAEVRERARQLGNPHLTMTEVPGAGHTIRRDVPDRYHALVDPFLAAHA